MAATRAIIVQAADPSVAYFSSFSCVVTGAGCNLRRQHGIALLLVLSLFVSFATTTSSITITTNCTFHNNTGYNNYAGGATVHATSSEACCTACWNDFRCLAAAYEDGGCYLKWSRANPVSKPGVMACDTGRPEAPPCTFPWDCPLQYYPLPLLSTTTTTATGEGEKDDNEVGGPACLDGSPYGYYLRQGTDRRKFVIELSGGGWCYSEALCYLRAQDKGENSKGSSLGWPRNRTMNEGLLTTDPVQNSLFHNATHIFLDYCDGASFSGGRSKPWNVSGVELPSQHPLLPGVAPKRIPANSTVTFRGRANFAAVIARLRARHGLDDAEEIVLTGGSAGGLSTILHVDRLRSLLKPDSSGVRIVGMPNAGFFKPVGNHTPGYPNDNSANFTANMAHLYSMQNCSAGLPPACIAHYGGGSSDEAYKCLLAPFAEPFVHTPLFFLQSKFDHFQLNAELGLACMNPNTAGQPYAPPWIASTCTKADQQAINVYGQDFMHYFAQTTVRPRQLRGCFLTSCIIHGQTASTAWNHTLVGGYTPAQAFAAWYADTAASQTLNGKWIENCSMPCNKNVAACAPWQ